MKAMIGHTDILVFGDVEGGEWSATQHARFTAWKCSVFFFDSRL